MRRALLSAALSLSSCLIAAGESPPVGRVQDPVCSTDTTPPDNLQGFYPPGPIRRNETGTVSIELTVEFGKSHANDVRVLTGSGFADLDSAAVKVGRSLQIHTECLNSTVNRTIHFEKEPDPPRSGYSDAYFSGETWIWVED